MASGDRSRTQNALDYENNLSQNHLDQVRSGMVVPTAQNMYNWAQQGADNAFNDYGDIMSRYRQFSDDPSNRITAQEVEYSRSPEMSGALEGYGDFARTGGFTNEGIRDIRSRGISPIRSAYGNTVRELDRSRALGGAGGSANYIAARSRAQRELPQQLSDATQGVNSELARMIQSGRLAGLGGLASTAISDTGFGQQAQLANQSARLSADQTNLGSKLSGLSGMSSMYSATPGQASTFGNQVLNATQNWLAAQRLQQERGNAKVQGQLAHAGVPTGFQSFLGNVGKIGDIAGSFADIDWSK